MSDRFLKPRTFVAVQFALFAFFFSSIIPFSGDFLVPVMWVFDKKVVLYYGLVHVLYILPDLQGAYLIVDGFMVRMNVPSFVLNPFAILPLTMVAIVGGVIQDAAIVAFWVRRKIRKKAPDLLRVLQE